jgi:hypothetical protein
MNKNNTLINLIILIILLLPFVKMAHSQELPIDSLKNYSYLATGGNRIGPIDNNGTGFIIKYFESFYFVTNYHVLTGRDPFTNEKIPTLKDTNTAIYVIFRPKNGPKLYCPIKYDLYNSFGKRNFSISKTTDYYIDIAILPIVLPENALTYYLDISMLDTSFNSNSKFKIVITGFPNGKFKNDWQPENYFSEIIPLKLSDRNEFNPYFYSNSRTVGGMSGSPIYDFKSPKRLKVCAINAMSKDSTAIEDSFYKRNPKVKGMAIQIKYVYQLIQNMHNAGMTPVIGQYYPGK